MTQSDPELEAMVERKVQEMLGIPSGGGSPMPFPAFGDPDDDYYETFDEALADVDPRDSQTAHKMFQWLQDTGRLHRVATLDVQGLSGYLFFFQEPKGTTNEGWTAGGTTGDRLVDSSLEQIAEQGPQAQRGLCEKCFSAVKINPDSDVAILENPSGNEDPAVCSSGGEHKLRAL